VSYKTIVVHVDADPRRAERLGLACKLAARFDAHLVGLFALPDLAVPAYALADGAAIMLQAEERWRSEAAALAKREFDTTTARNAVKAEWRSALRDPVQAVALSARYADLVIVGQHEPARATGGQRMPSDFVADTVIEAGRPVLVVPYAGHHASIGGRVLVAWNAGREAARAVADALPLLQGAKTVEVVAFDPHAGGADHGEQPGADIALYLARHGVKATAAQQHAGIDVGEQILSRAADANADLIVMGAYGHSRARELVLGGATRTVLGSMTVPVLMSH
jgi:nucleotide-binding universal stress UspA family protein